MKQDDSVETVAAQLLKLDKLLIASHYHPDADALGSSCGLALALRQLGKQVLCVNESKVPERYLEIPGARDVSNNLPAADSPEQAYQALVVCDAGDLKRVGDSFVEIARKYPLIINIDHHISNDYFGKLNLVHVNASSTAEVVFDLLACLKFKLTPQVATCLYAGVAGDTGCFKYQSTSARVFEIAKELVLAGAKPTPIADMLFGRKPERQIRLEALALSQIKMHAAGKIAEVIVTPEMYEQAAASSEDTEHLVEFVREIQGVRVALLIRRDDDLWKVSLRLNGAEPDLSAIAATFGGGGHKQAAAFRWRRELEELRSKLISALEKAL